jgi:tetratricopeptide (TPR) repeat protein
MRILETLIFVGAALAAMPGLQVNAAQKLEVPPAAQNPLYHAAVGDVNARYREYKDAVENFKKAIELLPEGNVNLGLIIKLAKAHMNLGQVDDAKAMLDLGLIDLEARKVSEYLMAAAHIYIENGMSEDAMALLAKARKEATNHLDDRRATNMLIDAAARLPTADAYLKELELRLEKNPKDIQVMRDLMLFYRRTDRVAAARPLAQKLFELKPDSVSALLDLALFARADNHPERAVEIFVQLIQEDPDGKVRYGREIIGFHTEQKQLDKALFWADKIADADRQISAVYEGLAKGYLEADNKSKAIECYQKAIDAARNKDRYIFPYARILVELGRNKEARELLEPMLETRSARNRIVARDILLKIYKADAQKDN